MSVSRSPRRSSSGHTPPTTPDTSGRVSGRAHVPTGSRDDRERDAYGARVGVGGSAARLGGDAGRPGGGGGRLGGGGGRAGGPPGPGGPLPGPRPRPRPRWGRIALVAVVALLVLALLTGGGLWMYVHRLDGSLGRTDAFSPIASGRPAAGASGAVNILMVGSDSRDPDAVLDKPGAWRADTVMIMHVPASHDRAYLVSIPRDLYVPIPESAGDACDSGQRAKINAAFAWGGVPLAVRTVECFTDVRIDHVAAIDFAGFKQVTDALGGVDLYVEQNITSIHKPYRKFRKGTNHMTGAEALDWVRQRKQFPEGDFARMRHQQEFLRALMDKAASTGTLTNPAKLTSFLKATTDAVTVDDGFSLPDTVLQFRKLRGENLQFLTSPHLGSQMINGESVVVSDREKALAMYKAMRNDKMADWVRANKPPVRSNGG
ncbi:transcriptional attenuator, LytR family [Micromonospora pattaloongensis]|uniref:Transcriptional attenuator, LytR family n=1 Tax=Micromonospora pattaloongensis TaxID=405436 RepID=A0A1H3HPG8_9ACTN|nr:LCP family protein [Micromonospora pattaloongensis]SDY17125.1 transcriptional attenuator, LytR family [Micromonospora pattaloongensis]